MDSGEPEVDLGSYRLTSNQAANLAKALKPTSQSRPPRQTGMFLKGPVPWAWLTAAGRLPGKALHVAVAIRLLVGMSKGAPVSLSSVRLRELGVDRHAAYRALSRLQEAGLVAVKRHRGRQPVVTVLATAAPDGEHAATPGT